MGDIGDNEETWLETTVEGTGTVRFDRKVSSDGSDSLGFEVDGHYQAGWTAGGWGEHFCQITTGGTHTLRWTYTKDGSGSGGSDCAWVDHVRWSGDLPDPNGWQEIAYTYDPAGRVCGTAVVGQGTIAATLVDRKSSPQLPPEGWEPLELQGRPLSFTTEKKREPVA